MIDQQPFLFLLCSERSGSNLFNQVLNAHSQVCAPPPAHIFRLLLSNAHRYGNLQKDTHWLALLDDCCDYLNVKLGHWQTSVTKEELLAHVRQRDVQHLLLYIFEKELQSQHKKRILVKENAVYDYFGELENYFSHSQFIYLIRDPRAYYASYKNSPNHPLDLEGAITLWLRDQLEYQQIIAQKGGATLRYEDLITQPEQELQRICTALNLPFETRLLRHTENQQTQQNAQRIQNWEGTGQAIYTERKTAFLQELTWEEIDDIQQRCANQMKQWHYPLVTKTDVKSGSLTKEIRPLSASERELREQRQAVIERVLNRNLV